MRLRRALWREGAAALIVAGLAISSAEAADPLAAVDPLPAGSYPVGCSNVEQDFSRVLPGESAQQYWQGFPSGGSERYVSQLLSDPADALQVAVPIPDDRELFVDRAATQVVYTFLVCYPTASTNPYSDYPLPTGSAVPAVLGNAQSISPNRSGIEGSRNAR